MLEKEREEIKSLNKIKREFQNLNLNDDKTTEI